VTKNPFHFAILGTLSPPLTANLEGAKLAWAHLEGAELQWAYLEGVELRRVYLEGAVYNWHTVWPKGFDPVAAGAILTD
jgi:uncharacterized protein YjbI with pentapeptide repeats